MYYVFVQNSFEYDDDGNLVPDPGAREYTIAKNLTEAQAQQRVRNHDKTHKPGLLGRYAKYDEQKR